MYRSLVRVSFIGLFVAALVAAMGTAPFGPSTKSPVPEEVTLTPVDNNMKYATIEFTVEPGREVRLVFKNTATSDAMQHNVVVLDTDDESVMKTVAQAGMNAGPAGDYVPDHDAILAHTPLSKPGETVEVTFTAPETPGEYGYLCTFPGHWSTMQGTMHVEE